MFEDIFLKHLTDIVLATKEEKIKEHWNVSGILNKYSNQHLKFDIRPMFKMENNQLGKKATTASKADKIVFETDRDWVIIDVLELNDYVKKQCLKEVPFEDLLNKLEWNIYIPKDF
jgi:hypothetical protein